VWVWIAALTIIVLIVWQKSRKTREVSRLASVAQARRINAIAVPSPQRFVLELPSRPSHAAVPIETVDPIASEDNLLDGLGADDLALAVRFGLSREGERFRCRGYSFSTLAQALAYARRLNAELATPFPVRPQPVSTSAQGQAPVPAHCPAAEASGPFCGVSEAERALAARFGIQPAGDRFRCRGYTFTTLGQALHYVRRLAAETAAPSAPPRLSDPVAVMPVVPVAISVRAAEEMPVSSTLSGTDRMLAVLYRVESVEGGFRCRDHRFATLAQALDYARRLNAEVAPAPARALKPVSAAAQSAPPTSSAEQRATGPTWFGQGASVTVSGVRLVSPMIYTGVVARSWEAPRHLVDTGLQVAPSGEDRDGLSLGYWPSYSGLTPVARHTYLQWLALGRPAGYGVGYVFLFFYGLERRLLREEAGDADEVIAEVGRLLTLYGDNGSFRSYARRLLAAVGLIRNDPVAQPVLSVDIRLGENEMPFAVRRYLGARLANGAAFEADDALRWLLSLPETYLNTPGRRCFDELTALWRVRFAARHPAGLKVRAPKRRLSTVYRSASGEFELELSAGDIPDIAAVTAPLNGLRDMLAACQQELEGLSRLLLRKPDARKSLEGALCLPPDLQTPVAEGLIAPVRARLVELVGPDERGAVTTSEILGLFDMACEGAKVPAAQQKQLAGMLDRLGYAFEPDRRHSDASLETGGHMVLYVGRCGAAPSGDRTAYAAARAKVEIAILASASDGEVVQAELDQIYADLEAEPALSSDDRSRLLAHALWLSRDLPRQQSALKRLATAPEVQRAAAARSAIAAVVADGRVLPAEVRFLEKLHKALGLPEGEVYAALHRGTVPAAAPPPVAANDGPGPTAEGDPLAFDLTRLDRLRQETSQVSALLSTIFQEEEAALVPVSSQARTSADGRFPGLDTQHATLLAGVVDAGGVTDLDRFEVEARALKLLPAGAVETINEWAFDAFDEPLLEADDQVVVVEHLRARLTAMETAA